MAEEAAEEAVEAAEEKAGGSGIIKWVIIIFIVLVVQGGMIFGGIEWYVARSADTVEELFAEKEAVKESGVKPEKKTLPYYLAELDGITVNPAGTNSSRFVVISAQLGVSGRDKDGKEVKLADFVDVFGEDVGKIQDYNGLVRSILIEVVRSKTIDQLEGEYIKDVQEEIKQRLNSEVFPHLFDEKEDDKKAMKVEEILFTKMIIQ